MSFISFTIIIFILRLKSNKKKYYLKQTIKQKFEQKNY